MLQTQTVQPDTLSLLRELMLLPELQQFHLVGGTALSLLYGHRMSVDLDLFSHQKFETFLLHQHLSALFKDRLEAENRPAIFGLFCYIDDVKIDLVKHPHPIIRTYQEIDGIRMFSIPDIMAMKVQAILGRGQKKDFWDIAELLKHYTVSDFIAFHKEKYTTQNLMITVPQALTYFDDADESNDPISLNGMKWIDVKRFIQSKVDDFLR